MKPTPVFIAAALTLSTYAACGAVTFTEVQSNSDTAYVANVSNSDLINQGASTLAAATVASSYDGTAWSGAGINDGLGGTIADGRDALYGLSPATFPRISIFDLNLATNTLGYDITSITSIAAWNNTVVGYGDQNFTVEYSVVGSASYTTLFANHAFGTLTGTGATMITATDSSGVLASGVDSIRVTYLTPVSGRTMVQEFDVNGVATVPEPSAILLGTLGMLGLLRRRR